jgi:hypothetical protein
MSDAEHGADGGSPVLSAALLLMAGVLLGLGIVLLLWGGSSLFGRAKTDGGAICGSVFRAVWHPEDLARGGERSDEAREQVRAECRADGLRILDDGKRRASAGVGLLVLGGAASVPAITRRPRRGPRTSHPDGGREEHSDGSPRP